MYFTYYEKAELEFLIFFVNIIVFKVKVFQKRNEIFETTDRYAPVSLCLILCAVSLFVRVSFLFGAGLTLFVPFFDMIVFWVNALYVIISLVLGVFVLWILILNNTDITVNSSKSLNFVMFRQTILTLASEILVVVY